ncbi:MAG: thymidine phosphorylase [Armatimonadota bacterium]
MSIRPADLVEARLGGLNSDDQLEFIAKEAAAQFLLDRSGASAQDKLDQSRDYWLAAWLAAACAKPLSFDETARLTEAMAHSGQVIDTTALPHPVVDKHSTGGVGDKTTIILLPMLAAAGLTCLKMSGKGLGHTGGTIDKLAAVPGFTTDLDPEQMTEACRACGIALAAQGEQLAPADGKLYQLRDLTGTVGSIPLIVASILSKKMAGGANLIGLDVKAGSGGIMGTDEGAMDLARWLVEVGKRLRLHVHASVTDMGQPLGRMVGNALEVKEAAQILRGEGDSRLRELCVSLAAQTLASAGVGDARGVAEKTLQTGAAMKKAEEWFAAQQGTPDVLHRDDWCLALEKTEISAIETGVVQAVQARAVGMAAVRLGAGRAKKTDIIDPAVGIEVLVQPGDRVGAGQPLFVVHHNHPIDPEAMELLYGSVQVSEQAPPKRPVVLAELD